MFTPSLWVELSNCNIMLIIFRVRKLLQSWSIFQQRKDSDFHIFHPHFHNNVLLLRVLYSLEYWKRSCILSATICLWAYYRLIFLVSFRCHKAVSKLNKRILNNDLHNDRLVLLSFWDSLFVRWRIRIRYLWMCLGICDHILNKPHNNNFVLC